MLWEEFKDNLQSLILKKIAEEGAHTAKYSLEGYTKYLRPKLVHISFLVFDGKDYGKAVRSGAVVELLHTASLIHDDIVDESPVRRRLESHYIRYGIKSAVLVGDYLAGLALCIASDISEECVKQAVNAVKKLSLGEILESQSKQPVSLERYLKIIDLKTATLFELAACLGSMSSNADDDDIKTMSSFGRDVGMAYQIIDDMREFLHGDKKNEITVFSVKDDVRFGEELIKKFISDATEKIKEIDKKRYLKKYIDEIYSLKGVKE